MNIFDINKHDFNSSKELIRPADKFDDSLAVMEGIHSRWHKSNPFKPEEVHQLSPKDVCVVKCKDCNKFSPRKARDVFNNPSRCGVCAGKIIIKGFNDALTHHPELSEIWDYQKNELGPESYSKTSGKKVYIKCRACKQSNLRQISNTINNINGCIVCSGKLVVPGVNDLASQNPELAKKFSKRNNTDPNKVYYKGKSSYWWDCSKCGHDDFLPISTKKSGSGCGYCVNQKIKEGFNDLATTRPELLKDWDHAKNKEIGLTPQNTASMSNKSAYFTCEKGHTKLVVIASKYDRKRKRVRICSDCLRDRQSYGESELFEFLSEDLGLKVVASDRSVLGRSEIDCYLPDHKIGFEFNGDYWHSTKVIYPKYQRTAEEYHSYKLQKAAEKGVKLYFVWASDWYSDSDFVKEAIKEVIFNGKESDILKILSKDDNLVTDSMRETVFKASLNKVKKVSLKESFISDDSKMTQLKDFALDPNMTQRVAAERLGVTEKVLSTVLKSQGIKWVAAKFRLLDEETLRKAISNNSSVKKACKELGLSQTLFYKNLKHYSLNFAELRGITLCSHDFKSVTCEYCNNKKLLKGFNDLQTRYPELALEWDNAENSLSSEEVLFGSSAITGNWVCKKAEHSFTMTPAQRTRQKQNCPYCSNRGRGRSTTSIGDQYPELASQWSSKNDRSIFEVFTRTLEYWWVCEKGHDIKRTVYKQKSNGCSACSGHKVFPGVNDFKTTCEKENRLDLLEEWDYEKNDSLKIFPNKVTAYSNKKAWWVCRVDSSHSWFSQIGSRWTRGCKDCSYLDRSNGFKNLKEFCESNIEYSYLIEEWDAVKNSSIGLSIDTVTARASKKAYWLCRNCSHSWFALISNRTAGNNCPPCSRKTAARKRIINKVL